VTALWPVLRVVPGEHFELHRFGFFAQLSPRPCSVCAWLHILFGRTVNPSIPFFASSSFFGVPPLWCLPRFEGGRPSFLLAPPFIGGKGVSSATLSGVKQPPTARSASLVSIRSAPLVAHRAIRFPGLFLFVRLKCPPPEGTDP